MAELYTLKSAEFIRETDNAILVRLDDEDIWIPFSQIERRTLYPDGRFEVTMTAWIAKKKGLI